MIFEKNYMEFIKACGGLPLSLEISSCYLCDIRDLKNMEKCIAQIERWAKYNMGF